MTRSFAIDKNYDLFLNEDGNLALTSDLFSVMQNCQTAAQAQLGEMVLAIDQGVPNFQTIWTGRRNVAQFEAYLRRTISAVFGVIKVKNLTVIVEKNTVKYTATIETIYGEAALNG